MSLFSFPAQVNERAARLVAATVCAILAGALLLHLAWVVPTVALGFALRVAWGPRLSPLARAAMWSAGRLGPPKPVFGAPKRFAQGIGAACTIAASLLLALGDPTAAWVLVGMVVCFAFLEASIAFCMGCWIYRQLQRAGVLSADACVDCGPTEHRIAG